jgi:hypothetical protein
MLVLTLKRGRWGVDVEKNYEVDMKLEDIGKDASTTSQAKGEKQYEVQIIWS